MGEEEGGGAAFSTLNNPDLLGARMGMALRNGVAWLSGEFFGAK
jgi:hypothetical protein